MLGAELLPPDELTTVRLLPVPVELLLGLLVLSTITVVLAGAPTATVAEEEEETTLMLDGGSFGALSVIGGGRFLPGGFAGAGALATNGCGRCCCSGCSGCC